MAPFQTNQRFTPQPIYDGDRREKPIYEILTRPDATLVMPSEQTEDFIDGRPFATQFLTTRSGGGRPGSAPHNDTTYARIFANDTAQPYLKLEDLRFPVGSVIIREKLNSSDAAVPELVAAMIKRDREFSPNTNGWEFFVIDRNFSRVKTRQTAGNCATCHAQAIKSDFVFKTYLK